MYTDKKFLLGIQFFIFFMYSIIFFSPLVALGWGIALVQGPAYPRSALSMYHKL